MNHPLSSEQISSLQKEGWKGSGWELKDAPELATRWANIAPDVDLDDALLDDIKTWLLSGQGMEPAKAGDFIIVAGEPVHTFALVTWAKAQGFVPVAATTRRESVEKVGPDGAVTKTNVFRHVKWRKY
jgi:hypothetical protein